jgi:hypothetical protein
VKPNRRMLFGFAAALLALFRAKAQPVPAKRAEKMPAAGAVHSTGESAGPVQTVRFLAFLVVPKGSPIVLPA